MREFSLVFPNSESINDNTFSLKDKKKSDTGILTWLSCICINKLHQKCSGEILHDDKHYNTSYYHATEYDPLVLKSRILTY